MTAGMRDAALALALGASMALAAACGSEGEGAGERPRPVVGQAAPALAAATLDGDSVRLSSYRGRPVLLNLWATWCVPCRTETPYLQALYEEHRERGLAMVGVSMDTRSAAADVAMFVEEYGVTYDILQDPTMAAMDAYEIVGLPGTYLIDREGIIRWKRIGPIMEGDPAFLEALESVLEE